MSFKKCRDLILGCFTLVLSGVYLYFANQIKTRPKLTPSYGNAQIVPIILGVLLAFLSVLCIINGIKKMKEPKETAQTDKNDISAVLLTFAVIILYTVLLPNLGFCLSTMIYLFLQMIVLAPKAKRNYLLFGIVSVVFTMLVFVAFRILLSQMLPRGIIESLLGF